MALLVYQETTRDQLSQLAIYVGQVIRCLDTTDAYFDATMATRIKTNRIQFVDTEDDRIAIDSPRNDVLYVTLDSKSFYRFSVAWKLVTETDEIVDIIAIYTGLTVATATTGTGDDKTRYALRGLATAVYTQDGHTVEDALKNITKIGTSIQYVQATSNNQTEFEIPYPFEHYLDFGNTFMVYIGTTFIDTRRYTLSSDQTKIRFIGNNTVVKRGRTVTFVFLFNSKVPINTEMVNTAMDGKYIANGSIPIIKMDKYSNSLYLDDINCVATSAAVHRLYSTLLEKIDAISDGAAVYAKGIYNNEKNAYDVTIPNYTLEDFNMLHIRIDTTTTNDVKVSINGEEAIPIYRDFFNTIKAGDNLANDVISLFYNAEENKFYQFAGIPYKNSVRSVVYTTVQKEESTFNIEALGYDNGISDHLDVYQDGIHLVEDAHYVNNGNGSISLLGYAVDANVEFTFTASNIEKMNPSYISTFSIETPPLNPGGEGDHFGDEDENVAQSISIGNWRIYSDPNSTNNLMFLYNNMLKCTITPNGDFYASTLTEQDLS